MWYEIPIPGLDVRGTRDVLPTMYQRRLPPLLESTFLIARSISIPVFCSQLNYLIHGETKNNQTCINFVFINGVLERVDETFQGRVRTLFRNEKKLKNVLFIQILLQPW